MDLEFRWILATAMTATLVTLLLALGGCAPPVPTTSVAGPSARLMRPPAALPDAVAGQSVGEYAANAKATLAQCRAQVKSLQGYVRVITRK
jgi:hypothetical protein